MPATPSSQARPPIGLRGSVPWFAALGLVLLAGCSDGGDDVAARPDGQPCDADEDCVSLFCLGDPLQASVEHLCAQATDDADGDGVSNERERSHGMSPFRADSDADDLDDLTEAGASGPVPDRDADGKPDAIESDNADSDADCLPDPDDADDSAAATSDALAAFGCAAGVCASGPTSATCTAAAIVCSSTAAGFEAVEASCDGLDNDCDGDTDEELEAAAQAACGTEGVCANNTAATCQAGSWQCNLSALAGYEPTEQSCDGLDNDCDGLTDDGDDLCDDDVPCTVDTCAGTAGCTHTADDVACGDGNPCTIDACVQGSGCSNVNKVGGCDDGLVCTEGEACVAGVCEGGVPKTCDDDNPCTKDSCDPVKGCIGVPLANTTVCATGAPCTPSGACEQGVCVPGAAVDCDDGNPCTTDSCDDADGSCVHVEAGPGPCDDGNQCTVNDACDGQTCVGDAVAGCCSEDADCTDANPCTADSCNADTCVNSAAGANGLDCDDGNQCTAQSACAGGVCAPTQAVSCNDGNACTIDSCEPATGCAHTPVGDGSACDDDGSVCTGTGFCTNGSCDIGSPLVCQDANPCTYDGCNPKGGCIFTPHTDACNDGNACTAGDTCASGTCVGKTLLCDDLNPCTSDSCDVASGCSYVPLPGICNDGDACTKNDGCATGQCTGDAVDCDDGNPCTLDDCDPATGCTYDSATSEQAACSDGNACTVGDICAAGQCVPGELIDCDDGNVCTNDSCDIASGFCKNANNNDSCEGVLPCVTGPVCSNGACTGGTKQPGCCTLNGDCDDENPCTSDACAADGSCTSTKISGLACEDGSACTIGDKCQLGACTAGAKLGCSDGEPCTLDYCVPSSGCANLVLVSGPCSDGDACNGLELCNKDGCQPASPPDCDDNNPCTIDTCNSDKGCQNASLQPGLACDDGSPCTTGDACDGLGSCKGTPVQGVEGCCTSVADCDDGYGCTSDFCDVDAALCGHVPIDCAVDESCTVGFCADGSCTTEPACDAPAVFAEGFEGDLAGWKLLAAEATNGGGFTWTPTASAAATEGGQLLRCGWGAGTYRARTPPIALAPGAYTLRADVRIDVDGASCVDNSLTMRRNGLPLADPVCTSSAQLDAVALPFEVTASGEASVFEITFQATAAAPDGQRGAWLDDLRIEASPDGACACE